MFARLSCTTHSLRNCVNTRLSTVPAFCVIRWYKTLRPLKTNLHFIPHTRNSRLVPWRSLHTPKHIKIAIQVWKNIFGKYLLLTNLISSGVLMVAGDACAQEIEYARHHNPQPDGKQFDYARFGRMFIVGSVQGPIHHYAYNWMERVWPVINARNITYKILLDQLFMAPLCILMFFYPACYMENKTLQETNQEILTKIPVIYAIDWLFWPGIQYINFRYLPLKYRVMYVNITTAVYNIFMSYMKHEFKNIHEL